MELELLSWLVRRTLARPWFVVGWLALAGLAALPPGLSVIGARSEPVFYQQVMAEPTFLWSLVGGLATLAAWSDLEPRLGALSVARRWRVRGFVALVLLWLPALPILACGTILHAQGGGAGPWLLGLALLTQVTWIAALLQRIPWPAVRSFAFVALAWWVPALASAWPFGPPGWTQRSALPNLAVDSVVWESWVGSMLTLALLTIGAGLVRAHHEVRHPR
jgi:hypothetical protein